MHFKFGEQRSKIALAKIFSCWTNILSQNIKGRSALTVADADTNWSLKLNRLLLSSDLTLHYSITHISFKVINNYLSTYPPVTPSLLACEIFIFTTAPHNAVACDSIDFW